MNEAVAKMYAKIMKLEQEIKEKEQKVQCRPPTSSHLHTRVCELRASQLASAISPRYMRCCERHSNTYLRHTYR